LVGTQEGLQIRFQSSKYLDNRFRRDRARTQWCFLLIRNE